MSSKYQSSTFYARPGLEVGSLLGRVTLVDWEGNLALFAPVAAVTTPYINIPAILDSMTSRSSIATLFNSNLVRVSLQSRLLLCNMT